MEYNGLIECNTWDVRGCVGGPQGVRGVVVSHDCKHRNVDQHQHAKQHERPLLELLIKRIFRLSSLVSISSNVVIAK